MDRAHSVVWTGTCSQRNPAWARGLAAKLRARHPGRRFFGYFLVAVDKKVTRARDARGKANGRANQDWKESTGMASMQSGLHAAPAACPPGHSLRECSLRHPACAVRQSLPAW